MCELNTLFEYIKLLGYDVRKNNSDGLTSWNNIKKKIQNENLILNNINWSVNIEYNNTNITNFDKLYDILYNDLNMKGEESDDIDDHVKFEKMHFALQMARIPKNNEINIIRICQIAYNIGQMEYFYNDVIYNDFKSFFINNKLYSLNTYIDNSFFISDNIYNIINSLKSQTGGAKYRKKYKKYKRKYNNIK